MEARHDNTSSSTGPAEIVAGQQNDAALALRSDSRLPVSVILLWLCAFAGLAVYTASWYVPSLAQLAK